jgi:hypothetical protein
MQNIETTLKSTRGRFFTLSTKQGERFNAQTRGMTAKYITVFDRNSNRVRKLAKSSVTNVSCGR